MSNSNVTWDALIVSKIEVDNKIQTVWEKKNFKGPDSKEQAYSIAKNLFELTSTEDTGTNVQVKNVTRVGSA